MDFKNTRTFNFEGAIRGMRNPLNSWNKSDSVFGSTDINDFYDKLYNICYAYAKIHNMTEEEFEDNYYKIEEEVCDSAKIDDLIDYCITYEILGPKDLNLAQRLICAGPEHAKFLRQIFVSVDITAPLYW